MRGHPIFAAAYDLLTRGVERGGLAEMRTELLRDARGRTLELGAGTGHNLDHYPDSVTELVLTEPDRMPKTVPIVRPMVRGAERRPDSA